MPNIGKDDHPKLWSLIFVLIIALTFCCFVIVILPLLLTNSTVP